MKSTHKEPTDIILSDLQRQIKLVSTNVDDARTRAGKVGIVSRICRLGADDASVQEERGAAKTTSNIAGYIIYQERSGKKTTNEESKQKGKQLRKTK